MVTIVDQTYSVKYFFNIFVLSFWNLFGIEKTVDNVKFFHDLAGWFFVNIDSPFNFFLFSNRERQLLIDQHLVFLNFHILLNFSIDDSILDGNRIALNIILGHIGDTVIREGADIDSAGLYNLPQLILNPTNLIIPI